MSDYIPVVGFAEAAVATSADEDPEDLASGTEASRIRPQGAGRASLDDGDHRAIAPDETRELEERFAAALAEARQAARARDHLVALVSHDLRSPLAVMAMGITHLQTLLDDRTPDRDTERLAGVVQGMARQARRMEKLIDELLDIARLQAGRPLTLQLQETDLVGLARAQIEEHRQMTSKHRFELHATAERIPGQWDPVRLARVIDNLLSNAVRYSPRGGPVRVAIHEQRSPSPWVSLHVVDEGLGIHVDDQPRIFDWFFRAEAVEEAGIRGVGIGLAGARQVVEQHGGTLSFESEEGKGSTLRVKLPAEPPARMRASEAPRSGRR
jgi:signal transduction histidine kinase